MEGLILCFFFDYGIAHGMEADFNNARQLLTVLYSAKHESKYIYDGLDNHRHTDERPEEGRRGERITENQNSADDGQDRTAYLNEPVFLLGTEHIHGPLHFAHTAEQGQDTIENSQQWEGNNKPFRFECA